MMPSSMLETLRNVIIAGAVSAALIATPALADRDKGKGHGHEHGHAHHHGKGQGPEIKVHDNGKHYRYEYKDGRCKYEYRLDYRTGDEKIKQQGDCRGVSPRRVLYPEIPVVHDDRSSDRAPAPRRTACNREIIGTVIGGVAGGIAGSQIGSGDGRKVATVAGAIIGAVIGGNIGRRMDRADNGCAYQAFEFAAPGETVFWRNPDAAIEYGITPAQLTRRADGRECREYKASVLGGGSPSTTSGVACRRRDGSWEIL